MVYKRPESVLVLVCTADQQVLLMRRKTPNDFWQSVTGSLRWGETANAAAQRELYEETGIRAGSQLHNCQHRERFPIIPPWIARYAPHTHFNTEHWFILRLPQRRIVRLSPQEHTEYRWLPVARAMQMARSYTNRQAIRLHC